MARVISDYLVIYICTSHHPTRVKAIFPNLNDGIFEVLRAEIVKDRANGDSVEEKYETVGGSERRT